MELFYDLHIHSALSPCADDDMTPNNIVNMARLKDLDVIAVCDHNCTANIPALAEVAREAGLLFVPGIELNTAEEAHRLVYFASVDAAVAFGDLMYDALPDIPNNTSFFGNQYIMDQNDEMIGQKEKLLISALPYSLDECCVLAGQYSGLAIPAHINKEANSILANLGFIPEHLSFPTIETWKTGLPLAGCEGHTILHDSDAHALEQISEREHALDVTEISVAGLLERLGR